MRRRGEPAEGTTLQRWRRSAAAAGSACGAALRPATQSILAHEGNRSQKMGSVPVRVEHRTAAPARWPRCLRRPSSCARARARAAPGPPPKIRPLPCLKAAVMASNATASNSQATRPDLVEEFSWCGHPVALWRWRDTGFSVVLCKSDGPITHGFFAIATEAHDDDGLPHTLEHRALFPAPVTGALLTPSRRSNLPGEPRLSVQRSAGHSGQPALCPRHQRVDCNRSHGIHVHSRGSRGAAETASCLC